MNNNVFQAGVGCVGVTLGGLLISFANPATAETLLAQVNPCPRIFYEEPFNRTVAVPQGCPPNAFQPRIQPGLQPDVTPQLEPDLIQPPLPEAQMGAPVATIMAQEGVVDVRLLNATNTVIEYEVIVDTDQRNLTAGSDVLLRGLSIPLTMTFNRPDGGFINVIPEVSSSGDMLEVRLNEAASIGADESSLIIQESGEVYVN